MEQNVKRLESMIQMLIAGIEARGLVPESLKSYKVVCNSIRKYQTTKAPDEEIKSLLDSYMKDFEAGGRSGKGKPCLGYLRFTSFVVGLLRNILETGEFVFAKRVPQSGYLVSKQDLALITSILEAAKLEGEAWKEMEIVLRHFFCWIREQGLSPEGTSDSVLMDFIINVIPNTNSGSIGRTMRALRYLSAYFRTNNIGNIQHDISFLQVRTNREGIVKPFSREEIKKVLSAVDRSTDRGKRDYAILTLGIDTGLRAIDIRHLNLGDIDWKKGVLSIVQSKTGKRVELPLSGKTMNAIADYILEARPKVECNKVFLTINKPAKPIPKDLCEIVKKYSDRAGLPWINGRGFHSLRRTFATELASAGVEIQTISQMLGHSSINEDKPYITYDKRNTTSCAFNFDLVPIMNGIYKSAFATKGGAL